MKAMLIWSDGHSLNYTIFEDKDNKTGFERAQEQMFKEYDERDNDFEADPECGACKAANFCSYEADGTDSCIWQIVEFLNDNPLQAAITSYSDACETLGVMVDVVKISSKKKESQKRISRMTKGKMIRTPLSFTAATMMNSQISLQISSGSAAMRRITRINLMESETAPFSYQLSNFIRQFSIIII